MLGFRMFRGVAVLAACLGASLPAFAGECVGQLPDKEEADAFAAIGQLITASEHKYAITKLQALDVPDLSPLGQQCRLRMLIEADSAIGEHAAAATWMLALLGMDLDPDERGALVLEAADATFRTGSHQTSMLLYREANAGPDGLDEMRAKRLDNLDRAAALLGEDGISGVMTGFGVVRSRSQGRPPSEAYQQKICDLETVNDPDRARALQDIRRGLFPAAAPAGEPDRDVSAIGEIRRTVPPLRGLVDGDVTCEVRFSVSSCGQPFGIKATCTNDYFESFAIDAVSRSARFLPAVRAVEYVPRLNIVQPFEFLGSPPEKPKAD